MSRFTTFVSRRMTAAVAVFAVAAALLVGYVATQADGSSPSGSGTSLSGVDPMALQAALDDPTGANSQLRTDLRAAFKLQGDARRAALADIRQKALDGTYGDGVQRRAERRQVRHDLFLSLLPDDLQADLTRLKDAPADQRDQLRSDIMARALAGDYGADVKKAAEQLQDLHKS